MMVLVKCHSPLHHYLVADRMTLEATGKETNVAKSVLCTISCFLIQILTYNKNDNWLSATVVTNKRTTFEYNPMGHLILC